MEAARLLVTVVCLLSSYITCSFRGRPQNGDCLEIITSEEEWCCKFLEMDAWATIDNAQSDARKCNRDFEVWHRGMNNVNDTNDINNMKRGSYERK